MSDPGWLRVGAVLEDPDGERWFITSIDPDTVRVEQRERGPYELRRDDLQRWIQREAWTVVG